MTATLMSGSLSINKITIVIMFKQITDGNLLQAIAYTSGIAGVQCYYNTAELNKFLDWYKQDTCFCTKETKRVAQRVVSYLAVITANKFYGVVLDNCEELIEFLIEHYDHPYRGVVLFQGDVAEVDGFCVNLSLDSVLVVDAKHPGYAFIISPWRGNWIQLSIFKGFGNMDQRPAAIIPAYVKDELIATITGRW